MNCGTKGIYRCIFKSLPESVLFLSRRIKDFRKIEHSLINKLCQVFQLNKGHINLQKVNWFLNCDFRYINSILSCVFKIPVGKPDAMVTCKTISKVSEVSKLVIYIFSEYYERLL